MNFLNRFLNNTHVSNLKKVGPVEAELFHAERRPVRYEEANSRFSTWTLTAKDENNLRTFESQILRKIFGPVNIDNIWIIRNNMEIDNLIEDADIVRFIKAQRIKWLGHIQRMDQARPAR
jgi:hypothetical protein